MIKTDWVYDLATGGYTWDKGVARYRSKETGRFVAERTLLNDLERVNANEVRDSLHDITKRMFSGGIDLPTWQQQTANEIRDAWLINSVVGRGGRDQMTQADWGRLGGRLRYEYQQLNKLAIEIEMGTLSEAQILARMNLYAEAARVGYWDGKQTACLDAGLSEERRVLNPAEHCDDCIGYADMGWQPIGTLPEPGEKSVCTRNCKCGKEYR